MDICSAFNSVDMEALWLLLKYRGIQQKLIDLTEDLCTNTVSSVQADSVQYDWFPFSAGLRQGRNITPKLFLEPVDWIMDRTIHRGLTGISVGSETFRDFDFADDVAVLLDMLAILILSLEIMLYEALLFCLEINWDKTKIQGSSSGAASSSFVSVIGTLLSWLNLSHILVVELSSGNSYAPAGVCSMMMMMTCMTMPMLMPNSRIVAKPYVI